MPNETRPVPAPPLDYAGRRARRRPNPLRAVVSLVLLLGGAAGGRLAARLLFPPVVESWGVLYPMGLTLSGPIPSPPPNLSPHVAALQSPQLLAAALAAARIDPAWAGRKGVTPAGFARGLRVTTRPGLFLVVFYTDADPNAAAAAVNAVMGAYAKMDPTVQILSLGDVSGVPRRPAAADAGGVVAGTLTAAVVIVFIRRRNRLV